MSPRGFWLALLVLLWLALIVGLVHSAGCTAASPC